MTVMANRSERVINQIMIPILPHSIQSAKGSILYVWQPRHYKYRIFAYPEPMKSIRDTLKQYQQIIDAKPVFQRGRSNKSEKRS